MGEVNDVKVKAHPKIALPIAYGTINTSALFNYLSPGEEYPPDHDGYYSYEKIISKVSIPDTIAFDGTLLETLKEVELRIETRNHFPMGAEIRLYFVDGTTFKRYGNPVICPFLNPATVDSEGKAAATTHLVENVIIKEHEMNLYKKATAIILIIDFYLPPSESNKIYLHIDDFLSLNIGMVVAVSPGEQADL
jgi:hypothetical protein